MGRASKNYHHSMMAGIKGQTKTMPSKSMGKVPMTSVPTLGTSPSPSLSPPSPNFSKPSIPVGRKNIKKY